MEELFELLGLDKDAPVAKAVNIVQNLKQRVEDKNEIIKGLTSQLEAKEEQFNELAQGVAEARVRDLVQKVQNETGYHIGGDENMAVLNRKAARYLYASEEDQEDIWNDMKAHCLAYGANVGLDEKIDALAGKREEGEDGQSPIYKEAKNLIDSGEADNWTEAYALVRDKIKNKKVEE